MSDAAGTLPAAPDSIEPVVGWRLWLVVDDGGFRWLESPLYPVRWSPQRALVAHCLPERRSRVLAPGPRIVPPHTAPCERCGCGVYAAAAPDALLPYVGSGREGAAARVLGRVLLWGKVVECERGWRAERAYPERLYVNEPTAAEGLGDYGVPVAALSTGSPRPPSPLERRG